MNRNAIAALAAFSILSACSKQPSPNEQFAQRAEKEVADTMKDPMSVKFKEVVASAKANCLMGQVLAKNSMGGYTGYHKFVWINGAVAIDADRDASIDPTDYINAKNDFIAKSGKCMEALPHGTGPDREENIPDA